MVKYYIKCLQYEEYFAGEAWRPRERATAYTSREAAIKALKTTRNKHSSLSFKLVRVKRKPKTIRVGDLIRYDGETWIVCRWGANNATDEIGICVREP